VRFVGCLNIMDLINAWKLKLNEREFIWGPRKFGGAEQATDILSSLIPTNQFKKVRIIWGKFVCDGGKNDERCHLVGDAVKLGINIASQKHFFSIIGLTMNATDLSDTSVVCTKLHGCTERNTTWPWRFVNYKLLHTFAKVNKTKIKGIIKNWWEKSLKKSVDLEIWI